MKTPQQIKDMFNQIEVSLCDHEPSLRKGLIEGYTQAQQDIKEACSEGFDEVYAKIEDNFQVEHGEYWETAMANSSFLIAREAYEAAKLSSMKELQEKDIEIEKLKKKISSFDAYASADEKYQEAVKDIEWLTQIREYDTYTELDKLYAIQAKYGLDKKEG